MSGNPSLSMLDANLFASLSALTTLDVSSNGLGGLPAGLFSGIENADFNGLTALTTLNLSDNNISELPAGVFSGLTNLTGVDVSGNPKDAAELFTLTATAVLTTAPSDGVRGMAVVEVVQGAPFEMTATVTISGGTFPDGAPSVTLATGATRSDAFAVASNDLSTMITVTLTSPENATIDDDFNVDGTGYSGFELASGAALNFGQGICGRTPQVRDAIVTGLNAMEDLDGITCETVTNALLRRIEELALSGQTIGSLLSGDFAGLSRLTTLDVSSNGLAGLPEDIFIDLGALMTLDVSSNALTELDTDVFAALSALTTLNMSGNPSLSMLDANLFASLSALTTLDVSSNGLEGLPAGLFSGIENADFNGLTALTTLDLSDNNISELPAGVFSGLTNLTGVDVSGNPKDAAELFTLTATAVLTTEPSDGAEGMAVVEVVQGVPFEVTAMVTISGGTFPDGAPSVTLATGATHSDVFAVAPNDLSTMITVTLTSPDNTTIDDDFDIDGTGYSGFELASGTALTFGQGICGRTPQVRDAIVTGLNALEDLNGITCETVTNALLTRIEELALGGQTIGSLLPGDFAGLSRLTTLDVSSNGLAALPEDIFIDLGALMTLDVSSNALTELDAGVFSALTSLETLNVSGNPSLSMLDANLFVSLSALTTLDVSSNGLGGLPAGLFSGIENADFNGLTALTTLDLSDNNISELPAGVFSGLTNLTGVDVSGNPKDAAELFTLTATAVLTTAPSDGVRGMAVVEVVQGAPFEVTAMVAISGGTFPNGAPSVTLATGATRSAAFAVEPE